MAASKFDETGLEVDNETPLTSIITLARNLVMVSMLIDARASL